MDKPKHERALSRNSCISLCETIIFENCYSKYCIMGRTGTGIAVKIKAWLKENPGKEKVFQVDGQHVYCKACEKRYDFKKIFQLKQHLETGSHERGVRRLDQDGSRQPMITETRRNQFFEDLCKALLAADIPLNKLSNPHFKQFLEVYCKRSIPDQSTLRKLYVPDLYSKVIESIRNEISKSPIWLGMDETTDKNGRFMANIMVGKLSSNASGQPHLLLCRQLELTNNTTVTQLIIDALNFLWPNSKQAVIADRFLIFLSDAAPYMKKTGKNLKTTYPSLLHITCLAHGLHRVAETVRGLFKNVDKLLASVKAVFKKAPYRIRLYRELFPDLPLPPEPVLTRWGTWLKAADFYAKNFEKIKQVVDSLDESDADCIAKAQKVLRKPEVKLELIELSANYTFIANVITKLETRGSLLVESVNAFLSVRQSISNLPTGSKKNKITSKINDVISRNPDFAKLETIVNCLAGTSSNEASLDINKIFRLKFCPVTSVELERGFSVEKAILSDNRRKFTVENLEKTLVCHWHYMQGLNDTDTS